MSNLANKIRLTPVEDLFNIGANNNQIVEIPLDTLHEFSNHPFHRLPDTKLAELAESIAEHGVLVPGIARQMESGYEIVAGHNRCLAASIAGRKTIPMIVKELTDAQATIIMVDSNLQRESLLPSERAYAYKMRLEAMQQLPNEERLALKGRLDQAIANELGESRNTMNRYISLTKLLPPLMDMVDSGKLGFIAAADNITLFSPKSQLLLAEYIEKHNTYPSGAQAAKLKYYENMHALNESVLYLVMQEGETHKAPNITIKHNQLRNYFPQSYTADEMQAVILTLLQEWASKR